MDKVDITVIGAGVVGLSVAARLSSPDRLVALVERNPRHGQETSSRNSEVIHAGIQYQPGSLKSRLCIRGRDMIYEYCAKHKIPCTKTGKLVPCYDGEEKRLEDLYKRGLENGVDDLKIISGEEASKLEPDLRPMRSAIYSPSSGIFSADLFMDALLKEAEEKGAMFLSKTNFAGLEKTPEGYIVRCEGQEPFLSRLVFNCAGHNADKVAAACGIDIEKSGYRQIFVKGEYFRINSAYKISHLIYPLPGEVSVGAHLTPDINGKIRIGPSAFKVDAVDYTIDENHKTEFLEKVHRYFPDLRLEQLYPDTVGVRAKLAVKNGPSADFIIRDEVDKGLPGLVSMIGIESPGLTAAPAIAEYAQTLIQSML